MMENGYHMMGGGVMWGMGLGSLLIVVIVVLDIVAPAKYIFGRWG